MIQRLREDCARIIIRGENCRIARDDPFSFFQYSTRSILPALQFGRGGNEEPHKHMLACRAICQSSLARISSVHISFILLQV